MAYVTITKDLTEVKDKVAFGLTKRQIVCFSLGGIAGVGTYFLTRHSLGNDLPVNPLAASGKRQTSICIPRMTFCSSILRMNILPCASSFRDR